jgi:hypothetical protein
MAVCRLILLTEFSNHRAPLSASRALTSEDAAATVVAAGVEPRPAGTCNQPS